MQILLCAATTFEIAPTINFLKEKGIEEIEVLITGVGMTAATYQLTKTICTKKPNFILQAGVAGCLDDSIALTKVVIVEHETIGDLGVMENGMFTSLPDLGLMDKETHPWKNGRLSNNMEQLKQAGLNYVNGVTVNEITTDEERIKHYRKTLGAQVETLEGAALHYVALSEGIKFLQLRSLSNFIGERDKSKWLLDMAIANLNGELQRILSKLFNV